MKRNRIVIISPMRNEEDFIESTIKSVLRQTIRPVEWIIIDDGSKDRTAEIVEKVAGKHKWIHLVRKPDRGMRAVGPGVVETFYYGYERLKTKKYDFICKMDGDIEFGSNYFETLLSFFDKDSYLGAASGKPFLETGKGILVEERTSDEMVAGMINFYRKECFDDIGGFVRQIHWDGIAYHRARMKGWRTRSINNPDLNFIHKRLMGSSHRNVLHGRMRWGRGQYFMGTHPLYILAIGLYRLLERPFVLGGLCIVLGYFKAMFDRMKRYNDPAFRRSLHAWQLERLRLGRRLEKIPIPEADLY